jgi:CHAT domain-containing protein
MQTHAVRDASPAACSLGAVRGLAEAGGYDWLHVAAHGVAGDPSGLRPGAVYLEGGDEMTADTFVGSHPHQHIHGTRPGFFLNACHGGRQGKGLTYLSGWAPRLLELVAGAIVAPLWTVNDEQALAFATAFYEGLPEAPIGEALRRARRQGVASGDPTALAYSVFAHPQAQVRVGVV